MLIRMSFFCRHVYCDFDIFRDCIEYICTFELFQHLSMNVYDFSCSVQPRDGGECTNF
jgi:hypothetical protein